MTTIAPRRCPRLPKKIGCSIEVTPNTQFFASHDEFNQWAEGKKALVMESFYRSMRKRLGILLEADGTPVGGSWNLNKLNRVGVIPAGLPLPEPFEVLPDAITQQVMADVLQHFRGDCFGGEVTIEQMIERFRWPVTPESALEGLRQFLHQRLENFGPYEDALSTRSWSLWHSHLSVAMNCGLLHPQRILDETLTYALPLLARHKLPLNSLEGFVRPGDRLARVHARDLLARNDQHGRHPLHAAQ